MKPTIFLETHNINNRATGLGTFNYELLKAFSNLNHSFLLICLAKKKVALQSEFGGAFVYKNYQSWFRKPLFRIKKRVDIWHSFNQNTKIEPFFTPKKGYVLTVHDVNFAEEETGKEKEKQCKRFEKKLNRATYITYISEFAKAQTHQYFKVPKVPEKIIYNGNPISTFQETNPLEHLLPKRPFFYSLGDFIPRKNFESIIKMMPLLPDFDLVISGNHQKEYGTYIKKIIIENQLENRIFLTGKVSDAEKQFYYKNCSAFLFPSIREGFGLPPIEAMMFKKPVFLAYKTSLPEIGADAAFYWHSFEPETMKDVVIKGLTEFNTNKTTWEEKLYKRATFFSWEKAAQEYLSVYQEILK